MLWFLQHLECPQPLSIETVISVKMEMVAVISCEFVDAESVEK